MPIPDNWFVIAASIALLIVLLMIIRGIARLYQKVPPNQALIVYGGGQKEGFTIKKGGGTIVWPFFQDTRTISLEVQTLDIVVPETNSKEGVKISVEAVAQVKVGSDPDVLRTAAEQLLTKSTADIGKIATTALQGHLRGIIATMTVEEAYRERERFQNEVANQAKTDMKNLGLEIVSVTVREITDSHAYMDNLGRARIAEVKRDAEIGEATADRARREAVAGATQAAQEAELKAEIAVGEAKRDRDVKLATFKGTSETQRAAADKAYDLQAAEIDTQLAQRQGAAEVERQKQAGLAAEQAIAVAQRQRQADTVVPARAQQEAAVAEATGQAESLRLTAAGESDATKTRAAAEAEKTRLIGEAQGASDRATGEGQAAATRAKLLAEAEGQRQLADARAAEGGVNLQQFAIEQMFNARIQVGQSMAQALAEVGAKLSFTMVGGGGTQNGNPALQFLNDLPGLAAAFSAQSEALAGKDLGEVLEAAAALIKSGKLTGTSSVNGGSSSVPSLDAGSAEAASDSESTSNS